VEVLLDRFGALAQAHQVFAGVDDGLGVPRARHHGLGVADDDGELVPQIVP
jgi:hypothetical protein